MKTKFEVEICSLDGSFQKHLCFSAEGCAAFPGMEVELFDGASSAPVQIVFFSPAKNEVLARLRKVIVGDPEEAADLCADMLDAGWVE